MSKKKTKKKAPDLIIDRSSAHVPGPAGTWPHERRKQMNDWLVGLGFEPGWRPKGREDHKKVMEAVERKGPER